MLLLLPPLLPLPLSSTLGASSDASSALSSNALKSSCSDDAAIDDEGEPVNDVRVEFVS